MAVRNALTVLLLLACLPAIASGQSTTGETNKAVVRAMLEAIDSRQLDRLDALVADDVVRHSPSTPGVRVRSLADFKAYLRSDFAAVPDSRQRCPTVIAEGDMVAGWCSYEGTQTGPMGPFPPSGKRLRLWFSSIVRFEDGKIAEMWVVWDNLSALTQLGHLSAP